jgi:hypothetical protein
LSVIALRFLVFAVALLDAAFIVLVWLKPHRLGVPELLSDPAIADAILLGGLAMYGLSLVVLSTVWMVARARTDLCRRRILWFPLLVIAAYVALCTYTLLDVLRGNI